jgi:hypothetical protein
MQKRKKKRIFLHLVQVFAASQILYIYIGNNVVTGVAAHGCMIVGSSYGCTGPRSNLYKAPRVLYLLNAVFSFFIHPLEGLKPGASATDRRRQGAEQRNSGEAMPHEASTSHANVSMLFARQ